MAKGITLQELDNTVTTEFKRTVDNTVGSLPIRSRQLRPIQSLPSMSFLQMSVMGKEQSQPPSLTRE